MAISLKKLNDIDVNIDEDENGNISESEKLNISDEIKNISLLNKELIELSDKIDILKNNDSSSPLINLLGEKFNQLKKIYSLVDTNTKLKILKVQNSLSDLQEDIYKNNKFQIDGNINFDKKIDQNYNFKKKEMDNQYFLKYNLLKIIENKGNIENYIYKIGEGIFFILEELKGKKYNLFIINAIKKLIKEKKNKSYMHYIKNLKEAGLENSDISELLNEIIKNKQGQKIKYSINNLKKNGFSDKEIKELINKLIENNQFSNLLYSLDNLIKYGFSDKEIKVIILKLIDNNKINNLLHKLDSLKDIGIKNPELISIIKVFLKKNKKENILHYLNYIKKIMLKDEEIIDLIEFNMNLNKEIVIINSIYLLKEINISSKKISLLLNKEFNAKDGFKNTFVNFIINFKTEGLIKDIENIKKNLNNQNIFPKVFEKILYKYDNIYLKEISEMIDKNNYNYFTIEEIFKIKIDLSEKSRNIVNSLILKKLLKTGNEDNLIKFLEINEGILLDISDINKSKNFNFSDLLAFSNIISSILDKSKKIKKMLNKNNNFSKNESKKHIFQYISNLIENNDYITYENISFYIKYCKENNINISSKLKENAKSHKIGEYYFINNGKNNIYNIKSINGKELLSNKFKGEKIIEVKEHEGIIITSKSIYNIDGKKVTKLDLKNDLINFKEVITFNSRIILITGEKELYLINRKSNKIKILNFGKIINNFEEVSFSSKFYEKLYKINNEYYLIDVNTDSFKKVNINKDIEIVKGISSDLIGYTYLTKDNYLIQINYKTGKIFNKIKIPNDKYKKTLGNILIFGNIGYKIINGKLESIKDKKGNKYNFENISKYTHINQKSNGEEILEVVKNKENKILLSSIDGQIIYDEIFATKIYTKNNNIYKLNNSESTYFISIGKKFKKIDISEILNKEELEKFSVDELYFNGKEIEIILLKDGKKSFITIDIKTKEIKKYFSDKNNEYKTLSNKNNYSISNNNLIIENRNSGKKYLIKNINIPDLKKFNILKYEVNENKIKVFFKKKRTQEGYSFILEKDNNGEYEIIFSSKNRNEKIKNKLKSFGIMEDENLLTDKLANNVIINRELFKNENYEELSKKEVAIILTPSNDWNGAFMLKNIEEIANKYNVLYFEINNENYYFEVLKKVKKLDNYLNSKENKNNTFIKLLDTGGHGDGNSMSLGELDPTIIDESKSDEFLKIDTSDYPQLNEIGTIGNENTIHITFSCKSGKGGDSLPNITNLIGGTIGKKSKNIIGFKPSFNAIYNFDNNGTLIGVENFGYNFKEGVIYNPNKKEEN